jgi:hypothetical protein
MSPATIGALGGISGLFGLLALITYGYLYFSLKAARRSVSNIIGGEQLFNADQVLAILAQFKDDHHTRLEALKVLTRYETSQARQFLTRIEGNIDVNKVELATSKSGRQLALIAGFFLIGISGVALSYEGVAPMASLIWSPPKCDMQKNASFQVSLHYRADDSPSRTLAQRAQNKLPEAGFSVDQSASQDTGFRNEGPRVDWFRDPQGTEVAASDAKSAAACAAYILSGLRPKGWDDFQPHEEKWRPQFLSSQARRLGAWF